MTCRPGAVRLIHATVTDLERRVAPFRVVADFQPTGDQPTAIDDLERRVRAGEQRRRAARRHRHRQVRDHRLAGRAAAAADAGDGAQQDAGRPARQRVPRAAARQRGRVLRLLLRLLPARGLRPADRHLHREGLLDQRRGRAAAPLGDQQPADPPRRASWSRRCRASTASARRRSTSTAWSGSRSARRSTATSCCAASSRSSTRATTWRSPAARSGCAATPIEIFPVYEELAVRIEMFGDEIERLMTLHPLTGEVVTEDTELYVFPATPLRRRAASAWSGRSPGSRPSSSERLGRARAAGQAARGAAAADAHDLRHRDDAPGRRLLRHRELLAAHRRPRAGHRAQLPARLLPRGLPARHRRVARHRAADRRHVRGRHEPQADAGRPRLPAAERDGQPAAEVGRSSSSGSARPSTCPRPPAPTSWPARPRRRRADHPTHRADRPRGRRQADQGPDRRPHARDPGRGPSGTSGCSSPR